MKKKKTKKNEEKFIKNIVSRYKNLLCLQIKSGHNLSQEGLLFDPETTYDTFWRYGSDTLLTKEERELLHVNFVLSALDKKEKEIIWNEFFFIEDKFWWMRKYNRSTFYRLRSQAIDSFCELVK